MSNQALRAACIHGRYERHIYREKLVQGRVIDEPCFGGQEVPLLMWATLERKGFWKIEGLPAGSYGVVNIGGTDD